MSKINLNNIVSGLRVSKKTYSEDSLFADDFFNIECPFDTEVIYIDSTSDRFGLTERVLQIDTDGTPYLVTAKTTAYQGQDQVSFIAQPLTLNGLYYFANKSNLEDLDISILYPAFDCFLKDAGIEATFEEILGLFVLNTQFDVYMLQFETDHFNYTLTAKNGLLKKITKKVIATKTAQFKSAFQS